MNFQGWTIPKCFIFSIQSLNLKAFHLISLSEKIILVYYGVIKIMFGFLKIKKLFSWKLTFKVFLNFGKTKLYKY